MQNDLAPNKEKEEIPLPITTIEMFLSAGRSTIGDHGGNI
jgi:hypothetical protein